MRIGIDLGGAKIEAISLADDGAISLRRRLSTQAGDYAGILQAVADLVAATESALGRRGSVGIASPGAISRRTGLIKNSNSTGSQWPAARSRRRRKAGEWGHNPHPGAGDDERPGPPCYCGKSGCIETSLSGPGLARDFLASTGRGLRAEEIARSRPRRCRGPALPARSSGSTRA
jgi:fructokinase